MQMRSGTRTDPTSASKRLSSMRTIASMARPRERKGPRGKFANRLRAARAARGLTQERAALELRVTRPTLALYETGGGRPEGPARMYFDLWICAALGEPLDLPGLGGADTKA